MIRVLRIVRIKNRGRRDVKSGDLPYKRVTFEVCLAVSEPASAVNENSREVLSLRYRSGVASGLHAAYKHRTS